MPSTIAISAPRASAVAGYTFGPIAVYASDEVDAPDVLITGDFTTAELTITDPAGRAYQITAIDVHIGSVPQDVGSWFDNGDEALDDATGMQLDRIVREAVRAAVEALPRASLLPPDDVMNCWGAIQAIESDAIFY